LVWITDLDDGGARVNLAIDLNRADRIGIEPVAMYHNNIVVQGAAPLYFLDYFATDEMDGDGLFLRQVRSPMDRAHRRDRRKRIGGLRRGEPRHAVLCKPAPHRQHSGNYCAGEGQHPSLSISLGGQIRSNDLYRLMVSRSLAVREITTPSENGLHIT
jgi:hypothetical protein